MPLDMEEPPPNPAPTPVSLSPRLFWIFFFLIALAGMAIRLADTASWRRTGPDELMYRRYVYLMDGGHQNFSVFNQNGSLRREEMTAVGTGAMAMPSLCAMYLRTQQHPEALCELPPTRFLYIYTAWLWKNLHWGETPPLPLDILQKEPAASNNPDYSHDASRRDPGLASLNDVACGFSVLLMIAGGLFAWRLLGRPAGLGVLALMACDPLEIHLSQHAMIDGFFAFWAVMVLWTTWECLRAPKSVGWLVAHAVCLALMVMTKENSFFVYCALTAVVLANRWLKFGTVTGRFLAISVAAPALGVLALAAMAGGVGPFLEIYKTLVAKAQTLDYARLTGDGPWNRYLVDLLIMSPIVLCLAIGALFAVREHRRAIAFLSLFVAASYLIMCNVRYGMNLRYASIWEMPLRAAAFLLLWQLCARFGRRQWIAATLFTAGLCTYEVRQYGIMVGDQSLPFYEVLTSDMLRHLEVIKTLDQVRKTLPPPSSRAPGASS